MEAKMNMMKNFSLQGKVDLVAGASYGIGFAIAKAMADAGATIVLKDLKPELVDKGIAAYEEAEIKAHGYVWHWIRLYCNTTGRAAAGGSARWNEASV